MYSLLFLFLFSLTEATPIDFCFNTGYNGYFISYAPVDFSLAHIVCADQGGTLVKATERNLVYIKDLILDCIGENQSGWISAWNTGIESEKCLQLRAGFDEQVVNMNCKHVNHAICYSNQPYYY
ncbi:hypothetical protein K501DRAFT_335953, partial [Backusella circina FSU 941]